MVRWLGAASLMLLLAGGTVYLAVPRGSDRDSLVVEQPVQDIGSCAVDEVIYLDFPVVNPSPQVLRVLGCAGG